MNLLEQKLLFPFIAIATSLILAFLAIYNHLIYYTNTLDLGIFHQGIFLLSKGITPKLTLLRGEHLLGQYGSINWYYFLASLYRISDSPLTLLVLQSFSLGGALFLIPNLAQGHLSRFGTLGLMLLYALHPNILSANLFEFHLDAFTPLLCIASFYSINRLSWKWATLWVILLITTKNVSSMAGLGIGISIILSKKEHWKWGLFYIFLGASWLAISAHYIPQLFGSSISTYFTRYAHLGNSMTEVALSPLMNPAAFWTHLFSWMNIRYLLLLFAPFIFFIGPKSMPYLIGMTPMLCVNLFSTGTSQKYIILQYSLPLYTFLILAVIHGANNSFFSLLIEKFIWPQGLGKWRHLIPVFITLFYARVTRRNMLHLPPANYKSLQTASQLIPHNASVATTSYLTPHLASRKEIYDLATLKPKENFLNLEYILLDYLRPGTGLSANAEEEIEKKITNSHQLVFSEQGVRLFAQIKADKIAPQ